MSHIERTKLFYYYCYGDLMLILLFLAVLCLIVCCVQIFRTRSLIGFRYLFIPIYLFICTQLFANAFCFKPICIFPLDCACLCVFIAVASHFVLISSHQQTRETRAIGILTMQKCMHATNKFGIVHICYFREFIMSRK